MKKLLSLVLVLLLLFSAASASGETFYTLKDLQGYIYNHPPVYFSEPHLVIDGTIKEIIYTGPNNHWNMTLAIDEPDAEAPLWSDTPLLTVHFRLHLDEVPFQVGDRITVDGTFNPLYSSFMVPFVKANTINGSEDF